VEAFEAAVAHESAFDVRHGALGVTLLVEDHAQQVQRIGVQRRLMQDGSVDELRLRLQAPGLVLHGEAHGRLDGQHLVRAQQSPDPCHAEAAHRDGDGVVALCLRQRRQLFSYSVCQLVVRCDARVGA
jgi:hypothetical protein